MATGNKGTAIEVVKEPEFTKEQLLNSKTLGLNKDILNVLLVDHKFYTISKVKEMVNTFLKGKVK